MLKAEFKKYTLNFKRPGGTSRGVLHTKDTYIITIWNDPNSQITGTGEAALFRGLSADDTPQYEKQLEEVCQNINHYAQNYKNELRSYPSLIFGLETALLDLKNGGKKILFPSNFTQGKAAIKINGLIWMGSPEYMQQQINEKLEKGFDCLKMKIGAIDFKTELSILQSIRKKYSHQTLELRVDANGAFSPQEAPKRLEQLARLKIHSIEQPIKAGQWDNMAKLCSTTPLPIALDEELIGISQPASKNELICHIKPQYIILKPALVGGFSGAQEWIEAARQNQTAWWITSALESNIGLNAIAQWTYTLNNPMPQGLGTGQVFANNFPSPLELKGDKLYWKGL